MKRVVLLTGFLTIFTILAGESGREIMEKVEAKDAPDSVHALVELVITESDGSEKNRTIEMWSREDNKGLSNQIMVFRAPKSVKNTRFLVKEVNGSDDNKWIFLPALGKARRIASSDGGSSFMGTEFTYDDMSTRNIDDYLYNYLGDKEINGYQCYIIESIPKDIDGNQYSKTVSYIIKDKDFLIPIKMELYNKKGELNKLLTVNELKKVDGYWIPFSSTMENILNDRKSQIVNKQIEVDKKTNPALFGKRFLTTGKVK